MFPTGLLSVVVLMLIGGTFAVCPNACKRCDVANDETVLCLECFDYFNGQTHTMSSDGRCLACPDKCTKCTVQGLSTTVCLQCEKGYYMRISLGEKDCKACPASCGSCEDDGTGEAVCTADAQSEANLDAVNGDQGNNDEGETSDAGGSCSVISYCDSCSNPTLACKACGMGKTLKSDLSGCADCSDACAKCAYMGHGETKCLECWDGFNGRHYALDPSNNDCVPCPRGCMECSVDKQSQGVCTKCEEGFILDEDAAVCLSCPSGCETCYIAEGKAACSLAKDGYYLGDGDLTSSLPQCLHGCDKCTTGDKCLECEIEHYLTSSGQCEECENHCDICASSTSGSKCSGCAEGFGLKSGPSGDADVSCDRCKDGCLSCVEPGQCTLCDEFFALSDGICHPCPMHCDLCYYDTGSQRTKCSDSHCDDNYALNPNMGTCHSCNEHCHTDCVWRDTFNYLELGFYSVTSEETIVKGPVCLNCNLGYGTTVRGECEACPEGCYGCMETILVQFSYGVDYENTEEGDMFCITNDEYECKHILNEDGELEDVVFTLSGLRKKRDVKKRAIYEDDITAYNYNDNCCMPGYYSDEGLEMMSLDANRCPPCGDHCLSCDEGCDECELGYYIDEGDCFDCQGTGLGCETCDSSDCLSCQDQYEFEDHVVGVMLNTDLSGCIPCPQFCEYDVANNNTNCNITEEDVTYCTDPAACMDSTGLIPDGTECRYCMSNCKTCTFVPDGTSDDLLETCDACQDGFALDTDGVCAKCPKNCDACTYDSADSKTKCAGGSCYDRYVDIPLTGECIGCADTCAICTYDESNDETTCTDCIDGYIMDEADPICLACPEHCNECEFDSSASITVCLSAENCDYGYGLSADKQCKACPLNCQSCYPNEETGDMICETCKPHYWANTYECGICGSGCETCALVGDVMECTVCLEEYVLSAGQCYKCPENCMECVAEGTTTSCEQCDVGYATTAPGTCSSCEDVTKLDFCSLCTEANDEGISTCLACENGYSISDDNKHCLECSSLDNCDKCMDSDWTCDRCAETHVPTNDGYCSIQCHVCGDAGGYYSSEECKEVNANATSETCVNGACWVMRKENTETGVQEYMRGCMPEICDEEYEASVCEDETSANGTVITICSQCCSGDLCNDFDISNTAAAMVTSLLLLTVMAGLQAMLGQ